MTIRPPEGKGAKYSPIRSIRRFAAGQVIGFVTGYIYYSPHGGGGSSLQREEGCDGRWKKKRN